MSKRLMGRIIKSIEIEGRPAIALFDSGATFTYIKSSLVNHTPRRAMSPAVRVALGGRAIDIDEVCFFEGTIEGLPFLSDGVPVNDLGHADGYELDAIIGARTMEQWEILLDPRSGTLNLDGLRRREFTEFAVA